MKDLEKDNMPKNFIGKFNEQEQIDKFVAYSEQLIVYSSHMLCPN